MASANTQTKVEQASFCFLKQASFCFLIEGEQKQVRPTVSLKLEDLSSSLVTA
ncbi:MAG: hypothetical protein AAF152_07785 [Cyanobacteria bacterium P01_A01_bin.114]